MVDTSNNTSCVLIHPKFERAYRIVHAFASVGTPGTVCFLTGASGAGKTTTLDILPNETFGNPSTWRKDHIPVIRVSANNEQHGRFSQKRLIFDLFCALEDPFRGDPNIALPGDVLARAEEKMDGIAEWRWMAIVERLGRAYGLQLLIVDEANLMCLAPGRRSPSDYLDALRNLAAKAKIRIVLAGTYDLLEVWNHNAQINRRCITVHIERYKKAPSDKQDFLGVLAGIECQLELPVGILTKNAAKIYESSYGIPGEVYSHVDKAIVIQNAEKSSVLSWRHFEYSRYLPPQISRMQQEADVGERLLLLPQDMSDPVALKPGYQSPRKPARRKAIRHPTGGAK